MILIPIIIIFLAFIVWKQYFNSESILMIGKSDKWVIEYVPEDSPKETWEGNAIWKGKGEATVTSVEYKVNEKLRTSTNESDKKTLSSNESFNFASFGPPPTPDKESHSVSIKWMEKNKEYKETIKLSPSKHH